jgi:hypothetical protein
MLGPAPFLSVAQWVVASTSWETVRSVAREKLAYYLGLPHQIAKLRRLGFGDDDLAPPGSDRLIVSWSAGARRPRSSRPCGPISTRAPIRWRSRCSGRRSARTTGLLGAC